MTEQDGKRSIERLRASALSLQVGSREDGAITSMIDVGSTLYAVKAHAIYALQLAKKSKSS